MSTLEGFGTPRELVNESDYKEKAKKISPFDFVNSITFTKEDLMVNDVAESNYNPFLVNRAMMFGGADTAIAANEMNCRPHLDNKMQYDFLRDVVRKGKRYNKWIKADEADIDVVREYFQYSYPKAKDALKILSRQDLDEIRTYLLRSKGGSV